MRPFCSYGVSSLDIVRCGRSWVALDGTAGLGHEAELVIAANGLGVVGSYPVVGIVRREACQRGCGFEFGASGKAECFGNLSVGVGKQDHEQRLPTQSRDWRDRWFGACQCIEQPKPYVLQGIGQGLRTPCWSEEA